MNIIDNLNSEIIKIKSTMEKIPENINLNKKDLDKNMKIPEIKEKKNIIGDIMMGLFIILYFVLYAMIMLILQKSLLSGGIDKSLIVFTSMTIGFGMALVFIFLGEKMFEAVDKNSEMEYEIKHKIKGD